MSYGRGLIMLICLLGLLVTAVDAADVINTGAAGKRQLLLVTAVETEMTPLTSIELRRLFMGQTVSRAGQPLQPLINRENDMCYQVFLQSVVGMSARSYEQLLISRLYRQGIPSPPVYTDIHQLIETLKTRPQSVSFALDENLEKMAGLKVIQVLWTQSSQ